MPNTKTCKTGRHKPTTHERGCNKKFSYYGGQAKCECGRFLHPDGCVTRTMTGA